MNTLTGIEAERVSQILRHAVDRLHILSFVPTAWNDDVATSITCDPVLASLEKQWISEDLLNNISLIGATEGGKDIAAIKQAHRATRTTCRNLMAERESLQVLMNRPEIQSEAFLRVLKNLSELKSQITDRMTTTVEDEATNRSTLQELVERERIMEESRDTLQTKLAEVREEKERVTFNLDQNLKKLQIELQDITSQNKLEVDSVQKEMTEALSKAGTDHELRMKQLQDQVDALDRQLSEIVEKNREDEIRLRKEKGRTESALNAKIAQYDEDMGLRLREFDTLNGHFTRETDEYLVLKTYFDKIDADLNRNTEEERLLKAVVRRKEGALRWLDVAATKIQKIARGRIARVIVAKIMAKKKGKGGKKGGKKGKK